METKTAQANQARVKKQLSQETQSLLAERKLQLEAVEAQWRERIGELEDHYPELRDQIKAKRLELSDIESKITGAVAELEKHREALSVVQAQVVTERGNVSIYESKLAGIQAQISEVSGRIAPLHAEKLELTDLVAANRTALETFQQELRDVRSSYEAERVEHERQMHNLSSEASKVALKIREDETQWERTRQDLAVRATKLDQREKTLEARELKLNRDERNLARNNELMNL